MGETTSESGDEHGGDNSAGFAQVSWVAKGGRTYRIWYRWRKINDPIAKHILIILATG